MHVLFHLPASLRIRALNDSGSREVTTACAQATLSLTRQPKPPATSNMSREQYITCVDEVKEHIQAGDIFQLVLSHRFKRRTFADPFEVYRCGPFSPLLSPDYTFLGCR